MMSLSYPRWILLVACVFLAPLQLVAPGTLADYQRAESLLPQKMRKLISSGDVSPHWIEKTDRFWYRTTGPKGSKFILVDAGQNTSAPAFDHTQLAAALSNVAKREYKPAELPFETFDFADGGKSIHFRIEDKPWACALTALSYECKESLDARKDQYEELSPDGKFAAYVKDYNLFFRFVSTGETVQLTRDGEANWSYATPLPSLRIMVAQGTENVKQHAAVFWSPDSSKLVTYRIDSRNAGRFTSLQFVPPDQLRPRVYTYVYPLPGEILAKAELIVFDVQSGKRVDVKTAPLELPFQEGPGFEWFPDSKSFYYDHNERGVKAIELRSVDADSGEQKVLIREQFDSYVDPGETFCRFVHDSGEIVWSSERDGWNHLYLYSQKTGKLENQITQGAWVVRRLEYVDEKNRRVYFLAGGKERDEDPYQTHLYSVGLDGKGLTLLSPEHANHSTSVSLDGAYFVDSYSRPDLPGQSVLRRTKDGSDVRVLQKTDASALTEMGWKAPETFQGKAADGTTDLYGVIWRPSNFDAAKKYPIVEMVYTGPQAFFVPKTFTAPLRLQAMAELGFVIVMVDGRGTTGRSRAFHLFSYRNLGGAFEDHVAMIKQMAAKYSWMDINRVGIYGTSAGGYGAAHAMLVFPEFYKVCVSISGDHDARLDKAWWNELYQGYPVQEDYIAQSNITMAGKLEGHLLLEHGDVDDNVHPVGTMRFVDALIKANKSFDMLLVPNMAHGEANNYLTRRRWDYFVEHLLGVTPPANFEIKQEK
jgi:dipeptidyl-peptidase-4